MVDGIDVDTVLLEGLLDVQRSEIQGNVLVVKFDREDLAAYVEDFLEITPPADVELTVTGELTDGVEFRGSDTIRVMDSGSK
jgi:hypothetical protein